MQLRELTHDVQTLEGSPLDAILDRPCLPRESRAGNIFKTPEHLLPSRWEVIERIFAKHGHCPPADLDIVYGSAFFHTQLPSTGKLYINCTFCDCDFEEPHGHFELIDNFLEGCGAAWQRLGAAILERRSPGRMVGNVVVPIGGIA